jgi:transmembrane sensor
MKDFRLYDISDFVMDEDFIRWVQDKTPEDDLFWNNWLQQNPDKHLVIAEARRIIESIQLEQKTFGEQEVSYEVNKLLSVIAQQPVRQVRSGRVILLSYKWWAVAAVLLLCTTGILYFTNRRAAVHPYEYAAITASKQLIEHANTSQQPVMLTLPDGSRLTLAPKSRVSYAQTFDSSATRDVYLLGEAFFEVTKNPNRPFRVFANEIVTKVLGTSFTVRSFSKDTAIAVIVRTGKVSVYAQAEITDSPKKSEIIVTPNQQLIYEKSDQKFQRILLGNPVMIVPPVIEKSMVYDDAPLEKVFNDLGKAYGINIVCDMDVLEKCTVTADLKNEPFYRKLDLVCRAIGARYELIDGQVVIESAGCR